MRLMSAENLIRILSSVGCKVFVEDNCVCIQGGNLHNLDNNHPLWKLIKLHYPILCKYYGVPE